MVDIRVPGKEEPKRVLFVCLEDGCHKKLMSIVPPDCPVHRIAMEPARDQDATAD
jgi:hypothetical protein